MAQALTAAEQTAVCTSLTNEVKFYQNQVKTTTPIAGEYFDLKMVIFGSKTDYATYSWAIFGNDTDNGGETLTGTPTDPTTSPTPSSTSGRPTTASRPTRGTSTTSSPTCSNPSTT